MLTAARLSVASTTGSLVIARCAQAASELVARLEAGGCGLCYRLEAALTLSTIEADYESVRSQFKLNEPELLKAYRGVLACKRAYLAVHARRREAEPAMGFSQSVGAGAGYSHVTYREDKRDTKCASLYILSPNETFLLPTLSRLPGEAISTPSVPTGWWSVVGKHGKTIKIERPSKRRPRTRKAEEPPESTWALESHLTARL